MLTPVDIQQKKFQHGMGYTKKDVDAFFDIVSHSYNELYKSNADLTNQVKTLTDTLVHYRTTESKLQKSLMLAEKNAEESAKNATDKAKIIETDAKIKANSIVHEAREELERMQDTVENLKQQYRDYACAFKNLMDAHLNFLATNPINEELGLDFEDVLKEGAGNPTAYAGSAKQSSKDNSFGAFSGDPQGREESTLGGAGGGSSMADSPLGGAGSGGASVATDSSAYTKNLGSGSFVDPFKFDK